MDSIDKSIRRIPCFKSLPLLRLLRNPLQTVLSWITPRPLSSSISRWSEKAFLYLSDFVIIQLEMV